MTAAPSAFVRSYNLNDSYILLVLLLKRLMFS